MMASQENTTIGIDPMYRRYSYDEFRYVEWKVVKSMAEKNMCDYPTNKKGKMMMKPEPGESKSYEAKEEKAMKKMMGKKMKGGGK